MKRRHQAGQATTEYIVMLSVVIGFVVMLNRVIREVDFSAQFIERVGGGYSKVYQYGDKRVKGPDDDGGPDYHARATNPEQRNFRIFINRKEK